MTQGEGVTLVVPAPLRHFLPASRRRPELVLPVDGTSTVGHLLASVGVPRTEVGELLLHRDRLGPDYQPRPGDQITVLPLPRPQPAPTSPPRFLLDVHLGTLARRMRLLGLDTAYERDAEDEALLQRSLGEHRVLLTRDRGLLHRRALRWGAHVDAQRPDEQLGEVLDRFAPPLHPWSRCLRCNGFLADVTKDQVQDRLPPGTRRSHAAFRRCESCDQIYWRGAHGSSLERIVESATVRVGRTGTGTPPSAPGG